MFLTLSKRFELSSSARLHHPDWDDDRNYSTYGPASQGKYGHGYNYTVYFVFSGQIDSKTGMIINVTKIKERIKAKLEARFDHRFLNRDTKPFDDIVPTPENIARILYDEFSGQFKGESAQMVACHVRESVSSSATAYDTGQTERHYWLEFSAARRTSSPHLSDDENDATFGVAANKSGHGHGYNLRVTIGGDVDPESGLIVPYGEVVPALTAMHERLDHKNLNVDVNGLKGQPITTECIARYIWQRLRSSLPVKRVRLYEMRELFAEYLGSDNFLMGTEAYFHAAHRLHSDQLTDRENVEVYDKCNNEFGHGHEYRVEPTIGGLLDERAGILYNFREFTNAVSEALDPWKFAHLDLETDDFTDGPSTGENIVRKLWPRLNNLVDSRLHRLRLWETPNNRFTLRLSR